MNTLDLLRHIVLLERTVGSFAPKAFFEPSGYFPADCANWSFFDDFSIQQLTNQMACFINMPFFKIKVKTASQAESVAGHIEGRGPFSKEVVISIDPELLQHPVATTKVLAHELAHQYLSFHHINLKSTKDDEHLTDVASIYLGFGKLVLNGISYCTTYRDEAQTTIRKSVQTGYLDLNQCAFVYDIVCQMRGFDDTAIFKGLNNEVVTTLKSVRQSYATSYPPSSLNVSHIQEKISSAKQDLKLVDLQLCNIEKIHMLFPGAILTKTKEIESLQKEVVNIRNGIDRLSKDIDAPWGAITYPSIPLWQDSATIYADSAAASLALVGAINDFVSCRVPTDVSHEDWNGIQNIVIECHNCGSRLRLPTGKADISVTCPKCKYSFVYSTTCPNFKWEPPPPIKRRRGTRIEALLRKTWMNIRKRLAAKKVTLWATCLCFLVLMELSLYFLIHSVSSSATTRSEGQKKWKASGNSERTKQSQILLPNNGAIRYLNPNLSSRHTLNEDGRAPFSPFKITTPKGSYYLVKLVEHDSKTPAIDIFCYPDSTIEILVPDGDYEARIAIGEKWYGYTFRFGGSTTYRRLNTILHFKMGSGQHVTFKKVNRGNLKTIDISENEF